MSTDAGEQAPLIETVVTTTGSDGVVNCGAMGVRWGEEELVFWPFDATRTLHGLTLKKCKVRLCVGAGLRQFPAKRWALDSVLP